MSYSVRRTPRWIKVGMLLAFYMCLIVGGHWLGIAIEESLQVTNIAQADIPYIGAVAVILMAYVVLTAIPFIPGAEIGLALLIVFGARIAVIVYLATIAALMLSFSVERMVPERRLAEWLEHRGFIRATALVRAQARFGQEGRNRYLTQNALRWLKPWLVDRRMITLIVLINLPGNTLLGGGGGIALVIKPQTKTCRCATHCSAACEGARTTAVSTVFWAETEDAELFQPI